MKPHLEITDWERVQWEREARTWRWLPNFLVPALIRWVERSLPPGYRGMGQR